jgi:hypothetical protein
MRLTPDDARYVEAVKSPTPSSMHGIVSTIVHLRLPIAVFDVDSECKVSLG